MLGQYWKVLGQNCKSHFHIGKWEFGFLVILEIQMNEKELFVHLTLFSWIFYKLPIIPIQILSNESKRIIFSIKWVEIFNVQKSKRINLHLEEWFFQETVWPNRCDRLRKVVGTRASSNRFWTLLRLFLYRTQGISSNQYILNHPRSRLAGHHPWLSKIHHMLHGLVVHCCDIFGLFDNKSTILSLRLLPTLVKHTN